MKYVYDGAKQKKIYKKNITIIAKSKKINNKFKNKLHE